MKSTMLLWKLLTLAGAAAITVGCDRSGHGEARGGAASAQRPPAVVTVSAAVSRDVPDYIDQIGRTAARESVSVVPQVGGRITAVHFVEGADVQQGQLLFEIDPRPFQAALAKEQATLAQNRVNLQLARDQWSNVEGLQGGSAVSKEQMDQRRTAVAAAEAQVAWAEAAVDQAKLNLEYCTIKSPIDGRTGHRLVDPGNVVKANEGTLVTIQRMDPLYADFTITERELPAVRQSVAQGSAKVEVRLPAESIATTAPTTAPSGDAARVGELTFVDNVVQESAGTVKLRATIPNPDRFFWPGQFVNVRLVLAIKKDAVLVPAAATQIGQQGSFVFVVKPDNTAEMRPVVPGQRQDEMVVLEQGVQPGEQVVVTGQLGIVPGGKVMVTNGQMANAQNPKSESNQKHE